MKIEDALPQIFTRTYPVLESGTQMLLAVSLLRFHQIDALPIGFKARQKKRFAVFGYSCLKKLLETDPDDYGKFLELPCEKASRELSTLDMNEDITSLLRVFQKTKFGFAWVESNKLGGFGSLRDLLGLYRKKLISTDLKIDEVASPIFSMPPGTPIVAVLTEMFSRGFRRVFVDGKKSLVTDRRIIGYVFSSSRISLAAKKPKSLLDVKLGDMDAVRPHSVPKNMRIEDAAELMRKMTDECLVCEKGVLTPWDLVMKPLALGKLRIKK